MQPLPPRSKTVLLLGGKQEETPCASQQTQRPTVKVPGLLNMDRTACEWFSLPGV